MFGVHPAHVASSRSRFMDLSMLAHVALVVISETATSQIAQNSPQTLVYITIDAYICHIRSATPTPLLAARNIRAL